MNTGDSFVTTRDEETQTLTIKGIVFVISLSLVIVGLAWLVSAWMGALNVPDINHYPGQREVNLRVSVNSTDPIILTVYMKSYFNSTIGDSIGFMNTWNSYTDIEFDDGYIQDENQTVVAQCPRTVPYGSVSDGRGHWAQHFIVCLLPADSEKTVTIDFNTAVPSGKYLLTLSSHGCAFNSDSFTIP
jgi:hypothetical protein